MSRVKDESKNVNGRRLQTPFFLPEKTLEHPRLSIGGADVRLQWVEYKRI